MSIRSVAFLIFSCALVVGATPLRAEMQDYPAVRLQALDKATARTLTFEAKVGSTMKYGPIYIRTQACRKAPPEENPESAAFLQIWEEPPKKEPVWVFSGWMFASSPALSAMDHPVYDIWVLDCLEAKSGETEPVRKEPQDKPATPSDDKRLDEIPEDLGD